MAFSRARFIELRPYLYHSTSVCNLELLRKNQTLVSAATLLIGSENTKRIQKRRLGKVVLSSGHVLQSQKPLIEKNIAFEGGWDLERLLEELNGLVFFWPGKIEGPIRNGVNHFESQDGPCDAKGAIVLRIPTQNAFEKANPLFCKYNSGSPRFSGGKPSPRGPSTFVAEKDFKGTPSEVVEVVFRHELNLHAETEYAPAMEGPWSVVA